MHYVIGQFCGPCQTLDRIERRHPQLFLNSRAARDLLFRLFLFDIPRVNMSNGAKATADGVVPQLLLTADMRDPWVS